MKAHAVRNAQPKDLKLLLTFSTFTSCLVFLVSMVGLLNPGLYDSSTPNWIAQTVGQDAFDLFIVAPLLLVSGLYAYRRNRLARIVWGGTTAYVFYTFLIYAFSVNFNALFAVYCAVLGLSVFSFVWFVQSTKTPGLEMRDQRFYKVTGVYFIIIAGLFYILWLMEIIPASIAGRVPESVVRAGLPTNPVHVIDLSMFLPSIFLLGLMILKKNTLALYLGAVALVFLVLMDLTIAALTIIMLQRGEPGSMMVAVVMCVLAVFSLSLLVWFIRTCKQDISH